MNPPARYLFLARRLIARYTNQANSYFMQLAKSVNGALDATLRYRTDPIRIHLAMKSRPEADFRGRVPRQVNLRTHNC